MRGKKKMAFDLVTETSLLSCVVGIAGGTLLCNVALDEYAVALIVFGIVSGAVSCLSASVLTGDIKVAPKKKGTGEQPNLHRTRRTLAAGVTLVSFEKGLTTIPHCSIVGGREDVPKRYSKKRRKNKMADYIAERLNALEDKLTQVPVLWRMNKVVIPALLTICGALAFFAFIGILGGLGTWDFYDALGQAPSREEELRSYMVIGACLVIAAVSLLGSSVLYRLRDYNCAMLDWHKKKSERDLIRRIHEMAEQMHREASNNGRSTASKIA